MSELVVAIPDGMDKAAVQYLTGQGMTVISKEESQRMGIERLLRETDAVVARSATKVRGLPENPRVKILARVGSGIDNFDGGKEQIDEAGIPIINSPGPNSVSVSELVFACLLHDARGIHELIPQSRQGVWAKERYKGHQLYGQTLGVVGAAGMIGREVVRRAKAFGMELLANDTNPIPQADIRYVPLEHVLRNSDYLAVHTPKLDHPVLGRKELEMMKPSAVLIQASRGGVVDEVALVHALENGLLRGAYLDVFTTEPFDGTKGVPSDALKRLLEFPNVFPTPHIGGTTVEGQRDGSIIIVRALTSYLVHGYLGSMCNGKYKIDPDLNGLRAIFHRAGMFMGQYSQDGVEAVKVLLDGELRTSGESARTQLLDSLVIGLLSSDGKYANPLNLKRVARSVNYSITNTDERKGNTFRVELQGKTLNCFIDVTEDSGELIGIGYGKKGEEPKYFVTRIGLNGNLAILEHDDLPGALAIIADRFAGRGVNIVRASTEPQQDKRAITVLELSSLLQDGVVPEIVRSSPIQYGDHRIYFNKGASLTLPPKNAF